MISVVSGSGRSGSYTACVATIIAGIYADLGLPACLLDLEPICDPEGKPTGDTAGLAEAFDAINASKGIVLVVPEYNGGIPKALEFFLDKLRGRLSLQARPVCLVGLAAMTDGAQGPVEQAKAFFGEKNGYIYPVRLYIHNIAEEMNESGTFRDPIHIQRLQKQAEGFLGFISRMKGELSR